MRDESKQKPSLFDALIEELTNDLKPYTDRIDEVQSMALDTYPNCGEVFATDSHFGRICAIASLLPGLRKRYIGPTSGPSVSSDVREQLAVDEFLADNERCHHFNNTTDFRQAPFFEKSVLTEVRLLLGGAVYSDLHDRGTDSMFHAVKSFVRSGPGASSDVTGDAGSYGRMAGSSMSFSSETVQELYKMTARTTYLTNLAEAIRKERWGDGDSSNACAVFLSVPKTNEKNRGICTQPSGNMVLQLATHEWLTELLKSHFGCDLSVQQSLNRELAYRGSKLTYSLQKESWRFCTFDLHSASNFPWLICQELLPAELTEWLDTIRSPRMKMPDGTIVSKHMCSTMGNGFTFSLMTLLLSAIVKTLYEFAALPEYDYCPVTGARIKTWAVYGDDIIVDKRVEIGLRKTLTYLGFSINTKKTFTSGLFRESCGADFFDGYPVRPVFCETLQTQADIYSLLNRLVLWGARHSVDLPRGLRLLRRTAAGMDQGELRVPNTEDVSHGLHVPYDMRYQNVKPIRRLREDPVLMDGFWYKALAPVRKNRLLFTEESRLVSYSAITWELMETVEGHQVLSRFVSVNSYLLTSNVIWKDYANVPAVLLHTLGGSVRGGKYGVRPQATQYEIRTLYSPGWGDRGMYGHVAVRSRTDVSLFSIGPWEGYVRRNLRDITY